MKKTHRKKTQQNLLLKTMRKISLAWSQCQINFVTVHLEQAYHVENAVENAPGLKTTCGLKI